jgi:Asp-tRNA(Asn)/Glu-tRNA(Gln) amidotransferase A subunit family amidase
MSASADPWNAFITRVEPGEPQPGPLSGRTLAVKDLFDTAGIRTT